MLYYSRNLELLLIGGHSVHRHKKELIYIRDEHYKDLFLHTKIENSITPNFPVTKFLKLLQYDLILWSGIMQIHKLRKWYVGRKPWDTEVRNGDCDREVRRKILANQHLWIENL